MSGQDVGFVAALDGTARFTGFDRRCSNAFHAPSFSLEVGSPVRCPDVFDAGGGDEKHLGPPGLRRPDMKVFYLAHDLDDSAIWRRTKQFKRGGAHVKLAGFRRNHKLPNIAESPDICVEFGQTSDGRLGRRVWSVVSTSLRLGRWRDHARDCDVIVARGLEMLALGALLQATSRRRTALVYECLDIHRLMVSPTFAGRGLRLIEHRLMRQCSMLITSSPAFVRHYFEVHHRPLPPVLVWENRMLADEADQDLPRSPSMPSEPWKIGWFGIIRCERSLSILQSLCLAFPGLVEVHIRGRPTRDLAPRIATAVASTPGLIFGGPYDRARDLSRLYGQVHFTWAIDYFEDGANSEWLLPNRLYEGAGHGAIPLALRRVETGQWMLRKAFGVVLGADTEKELVGFFATLDREKYRLLSNEMNTVDPSAFVQPDDELISIVGRLASLTSQIASTKADGG